MGTNADWITLEESVVMFSIRLLEAQKAKGFDVSEKWAREMAERAALIHIQIAYTGERKYMQISSPMKIGGFMLVDNFHEVTTFIQDQFVEWMEGFLHSFL